MVWLLVLARRSGDSDAALLDSYPALRGADLESAWDYYRDHPIEIERDIWYNEVAGNVPGGTLPPAAALIAGVLLGIDEPEMRAAFDPPLAPGALAAAWAEYRDAPRRVDRDLANLRSGG